VPRRGFSTAEAEGMTRRELRESYNAQQELKGRR
jgi:hypothetical protein